MREAFLSSRLVSKIGTGRMCGIVGTLNYSLQAKPDESLLRFMMSKIAHRGPDGQGILLEDGIGLGHVRLSIIDLSGGAQPIHNEDQSVWVVFNGEIFNFVELREELEKNGHQFYTRTDTEVIVHLYEEYGEAFVAQMNGQFSIALWDRNLRKLMLIRDRPGILPLYYTEQNGSLTFASEIKAILPTLTSSPKLDATSLDQLMTFWSPVSPNTLFEDIYEVSPGQMLVAEQGKRLRQVRYWDWQFPQAPDDYWQESEEFLSDRLHEILIDATRIRLRSDVPVGAYLSGGLDSSVLVSLIKRYSNVPLRTFSIEFEDKALDESEYQRALVQHLGTEHSRIQCRNRDIADRFPEAIWHTESAVLRTAPVPMGLLSGLVRNSDYKVVLTGEGSDEVLGGYDIFKEAKIRQFWARNPDSTFRPLLLKRLYPYLNLDRLNVQNYLKGFFGTGLDAPQLDWFSHLPRWETTAKCKEFFSEELKGRLKDSAMDVIVRSLPEEIARWHPFNKAQYLEAKSLMGGYLLSSQGDRMLTWHSIEGRFPFLDHRLIEFANRLPPKFKMNGLNEKYLLKKCMARYLPDKITSRYKQPYRAPDIPAFFGTQTPEYVRGLLSESKIAGYGYFDARKVSLLVKKIEKGRALGYKDNMALVGILSTQIWHQLFIERFRENFRLN